MPPDHHLDDYVDPYEPGHRHGGPPRIGLGGPVGSGKTALAAALCRTLGAEYDLAVVTNDIYTTEDAAFLRRNAVLPDHRSQAVQPRRRPPRRPDRGRSDRVRPTTRDPRRHHRQPRRRRAPRVTAPRPRTGPGGE